MSFDALPSDVVGIIFSLIPPEDVAIRKAFYASCKTVRTCVVQDQIHSMKLDVSRLPAYNPFVSFPRESSLKSLQIGRTLHDSEDTTFRVQGLELSDGVRLLQLLQPPLAGETAKARIRQSMRSVEVLNLEHLYLKQSGAAAIVARTLSVLCPKLKVLNIRNCNGLSSNMEFFLQHLSGCRDSGGLQLQELHFSPVSQLSVALVETFGRFVSLETLDLKENASLPRFRALDQTYTQVIISAGLERALHQLPCLKSLGISDVFLLSRCTGLGGSLQFLSIERMTNLDLFFNVLSLKRNSPSLQHVHVDKLEKGRQGGPNYVKAASERVAMGLAEFSGFCVSIENADLPFYLCAPLFEPLAGTSFLRAIKCVKVYGGGRFLTIESVAALSSIASLEELHFYSCYIVALDDYLDCVCKAISGLHQLKQLSFTFPKQSPIYAGFDMVALSICMAAQSDPLRSHLLHVSCRAEMAAQHKHYACYDHTVAKFLSLEKSWMRMKSATDMKVSLHSSVCFL